MAGFFRNNNANQNVSERQLLESKYAGARSNLLLVVAFTVINIVLLVSKSYTYFLFSAFIPYFLTDLGMFLCGMYPEEVYADLFMDGFLDQSFFAITIVIAAVILAGYLLAWIFSKKHRVGWVIFALVFFGLDTIGMLLINGFAMDSIVDILFHGWVIFSLINGIVAHYKLKKLPSEAEAPVCAEQTEALLQNSDV